MPAQRRKSNIDNYTFFCSMLYIIENGCKWRAMLSKFDNWHTIYTKFNRWSKNGTLEHIFKALQSEGIIAIKTNIIYLDSTCVKVHPNGTGSLK